MIAHHNWANDWVVIRNIIYRHQSYLSHCLHNYSLFTFHTLNSSSFKGILKEFLAESIIVWELNADIRIFGNDLFVCNKFTDRVLPLSIHWKWLKSNNRMLGSSREKILKPHSKPKIIEILYDGIICSSSPSIILFSFISIIFINHEHSKHSMVDHSSAHLHKAAVDDTSA